MKCVYQLRKSHIDFYFNANYGSLCCVVYINIVQQLQVVYFVSLHRVCAVDRDNLRLYYDEMTMMMMMMMACSENVQSVRIWSNPLTCYFSVFILIMGTARHDMPPRRLVNLCYDIWKCKKKKKYDRDEPRIAMTNTRLDCSKNIYIYTFFWWIQKLFNYLRHGRAVVLLLTWPWLVSEFYTLRFGSVCSNLIYSLSSCSMCVLIFMQIILDFVYTCLWFRELLQIAEC